MATYNGRLIVTPPSTPYPASMEGGYNVVAAGNKNPFTLQDQLQDWAAQSQQVSVSFPPMKQSDAQAWIAFLKSCRGITNVFQFTAGFVSLFPETLTTDGTTQPYWQLKSNDQKWSVSTGKIFGLTFECEQVVV